MRTARERGVPQALEDYRAGRRDSPTPPRWRESTVNSIGYVLLREKKAADAVAVFEQNVADYPDSWNAYDSLGEALAADGKTERAIAAYERSLQLNPGNTGGAEALKRLRASPSR